MIGGLRPATLNRRANSAPTPDQVGGRLSPAKRAPELWYEALPAPEAHRILQRLEFHDTPKHASRLNRVEIEIGVLRGQCLDRRVGDPAVLNTQVAAWQRQRNASGAGIKWKFTTQKARQKLARAYPDAAKELKSL